MPSFTARMQRSAEGETYLRHRIVLPDELAARLGDARVVGTVDGHPIRRATHPHGRTGRCLRFGEAFLQETGLREGAHVEVELERDPDPDEVSLPVELEQALAEDEQALFVWETLTPGRQRTLAYPVGQAKRADTRARRAAKLVADLKAGRTNPRRRR